MPEKHDWIIQLVYFNVKLRLARVESDISEQFVMHQENMDTSVVSGGTVPSARGGASGNGIPFPPPASIRRGSNDFPHSSGGLEPAAKRVNVYFLKKF